MQKLYLKSKAGFQVIDKQKPIVIRDCRGTIFYDTNPILPKVEKFNLPPGNYFIDSGHFRKMANPVIYPLFPLPFRERWFYPNPKGFKIEFGNNPNTCSILWLKRKIVFDESMRESPLPELYYILFHEWGHERYKTEKYADLSAANEMLKFGFNPIQIGESSILSLSDNNYERKVYISNKILNYVRRRKRG